MAGEREPSRLFTQIIEANVSDDEIEALYGDLKYIFESSFDEAVHEAVSNRGAHYVEMPEQRIN